MATPQTFELRYVYEYLQYLFNHKDVDQARAGVAASRPALRPLLLRSFGT